MGSKLMNNKFVGEQEDSEHSPENSEDSPRAAVSYDTKMSCTSSPKRSRRALHKRVVTVPIKDIERSRLKGDLMSSPPSDSWAWRKYGQKPIKGSPYPRGYYRCSSSKGCPARKQVERSRTDPDVLLVTYSCEHNHPWPASRNNHHHHSTTFTTTTMTTTMTRVNKRVTTSVSEEDDQEELEEEEEEKKHTNVSTQPNPDSEEKFNLGEGSLMNSIDFGWFDDYEPTSCTMLESSILTEELRVNTDNEMAMIFTMRDEDESLFAGLGELPECSAVLRRGLVEEHRRQSMAPA